MRGLRLPRAARRHDRRPRTLSPATLRRRARPAAAPASAENGRKAGSAALPGARHFAVGAGAPTGETAGVSYGGRAVGAGLQLLAPRRRPRLPLDATSS